MVTKTVYLDLIDINTNRIEFRNKPLRSSLWYSGLGSGSVNAGAWVPAVIHRFDPWPENSHMGEEKKKKLYHLRFLAYSLFKYFL